MTRSPKNGRASSCATAGVLTPRDESFSNARPMSCKTPARIKCFRPAHQITPDVQRLYELNRLMVTRQLHFSAANPDLSIDTVLGLNGIPVMSAELKNPLTGQDKDDAIRQYRTDRDPRELLFAHR